MNNNTINKIIYQLRISDFLDDKIKSNHVVENDEHLETKILNNIINERLLSVL